MDNQEETSKPKNDNQIEQRIGGVVLNYRVLINCKELIVINIFKINKRYLMASLVTVLLIRNFNFFG